MNDVTQGRGVGGRKYRGTNSAFDKSGTSNARASANKARSSGS